MRSEMVLKESIGKLPIFTKKKTAQQRKSAMMHVIDAFKTKSPGVGDSILELEERDPDGFVDELGRTIRWERAFNGQEAQYQKIGCGRKGERILSDIEAVEALQQLNEDMYDRLEARRRALANWSRLKIVIVILKMTGGRVYESASVSRQELPAQ